MTNKENLLEATISILNEDINRININVDEICKLLQQVKNIVKVEYNSEFENYNCKGCYILYISKYFKRLANQWSIGPKALSDRIDTMSDIREIMDKNYGVGNYRVNVSDDYDGYWYIELIKE